METVQPPATPTPSTPNTSAPSRGIFGTGIPTSIAFVVGALLFLMPFVDLKCNNVTLKEVSGLQLATGFEVKNQRSNSIFDGVDQTASTSTGQKSDPFTFGMIALALAVLAAVVSFLKFGGRPMICFLLGCLTAAALIGLMIEVKDKVKVDLGQNKVGNDSLNLNLGGSAEVIQAEFTGWFYFAILLFILGAVFSWQLKKQKA